MEDSGFVWNTSSQFGRWILAAYVVLTLHMIYAWPFLPGTFDAFYILVQLYQENVYCFYWHLFFSISLTAVKIHCYLDIYFPHGFWRFSGVMGFDTSSSDSGTVVYLRSTGINPVFDGERSSCAYEYASFQ